MKLLYKHLFKNGFKYFYNLIFLYIYIVVFGTIKQSRGPYVHQYVYMHVTKPSDSSLRITIQSCKEIPKPQKSKFSTMIDLCKNLLSFHLLILLARFYLAKESVNFHIKDKNK